MSEPKLVVEMAHVTKTYPGATKPAVADLSLRLHSGEIFSLLGPNGAGKTTTVKMLAGLVSPTTGEVQVMGHDMIRQRTRGAGNLGAVLEGARNLYWRLSARENLRYFGGLRLVPRRELEERIDGLLALLDLTAHQDREVRTFSRGMQQKLALAAALLHDPPVLLLDEPTLGLDVAAARQLESTIERLAREEGKAILLTTHTMSLAEKLSDRILIINEGQTLICDTTARILQEADFHEDLVQVRVAGRLPDELSRRLVETIPELRLSDDDEQTVLTWPAPAQADLLALLQTLDQQGVQIVDVVRRQPTLEEVFLHLTGGRQE